MTPRPGAFAVRRRTRAVRARERPRHNRVATDGEGTRRLVPAVLSRATSRAAIGVVLLLGVLVAPGYATTPAGAPADLSDGRVGGGQRITDTPRIRASLTVADAFYAARPDCPLGIEVYRKALPDGVDGLTDAAAYPCSIWIALARYSQRTFVERVRTCGLVVHEVGHLLRLRFANPPDPTHSGAATSIMRPGELTATLKPLTPIGCYRRFVPRNGGRDFRASTGGPPRWATVGPVAAIAPVTGPGPAAQP